MNDRTTKEKVDAYDGFVEAFRHLNKELRALGMKKPTETLNQVKAQLINRILTDMRAFLGDEPEGRYLELLDEEALPQYSDAILILSQYEAALAGFRRRFSAIISLQASISLDGLNKT